MKGLVTTLAVALTMNAGAVLAGSLINQDGRSWEYKLVCTASTTKSKIEGNTTQARVLRQGCRIILRNGQEYTVKGLENVVIKKGKLERE